MEAGILMFHEKPALMRLSDAHLPGGDVPSMRPDCWILKKLRSPALALVQLPEHLAR